MVLKQRRISRPDVERDEAPEIYGSGLVTDSVMRPEMCGTETAEYGKEACYDEGIQTAANRHRGF